MKKLLVLVLAAAMALCLFTACTGQTDKPGDPGQNGGQTSNPGGNNTGDTDTQKPEDGSDQDGATGDVDLSAFFTQLETDYELGSLVDIEGDVMDNFYPGLTAVSTLQLIAKMAMITASANEIVLIQCENSDDVATVQAILEARKQAQADGGAWYPESVALWESAEICVSGNYLMLVTIHPHP